MSSGSLDLTQFGFSITDDIYVIASMQYSEYNCIVNTSVNGTTLIWKQKYWTGTIFDDSGLVITFLIIHRI